MNPEMAKMAGKMREANQRRDEAVRETANHAKDNLLTHDEAAKCVAGAMLKAADELG